MIQFFKKYVDIINACLFVITIYFFEIISLDFYKFNLQIGFIGFFIILLNTIFFGKGFLKETKIFSSILAILLLFNVGIGYSMPCDTLHLKMFLSGLAFFGVYITAFNLGVTFNKDFIEIYIVNVAKVLLVISIAYLLMQFYLSDNSFGDFHGEYLDWSYAHKSFDAFNPRLSSFFSEPSLFALKTIILYCLILLKKNIYNYFLILMSALIIFWFSFSLNFLVLFLFLFLLFFSHHLFIIHRDLFFIFVGSSLTFLILMYIDDFSLLTNFPYIYSRVSFVNDSSFMSITYSGLLYLQSWLDAFGSFYHTNLLGSGFNQESCFPRYPGLILELASKNPNPISTTEGGSVFFAKYLNEWGLIGVLIIISILCYLIYLFLTKERNTFSDRILVGIFILFIMAISRSNTYFQFILFPFLFAIFIKLKK